MFYLIESHKFILKSSNSREYMKYYLSCYKYSMDFVKIIVSASKLFLCTIQKDHQVRYLSLEKCGSEK